MYEIKLLFFLVILYVHIFKDYYLIDFIGKTNRISFYRKLILCLKKYVLLV